MRTKTIIGLAAAAVVLTAVVSGAASAQGSGLPVKGKVVLWNEATMSLEKKLDSARDSVRRSQQDDLFFIGYLFPSRTTIRHGLEGSAGPFEVVVKGGEVEFRGSGDSESYETKDQSGPAGLLILFALSKPKSGGLSAHLFDPRKSYEFKKVPVYWLGSVDAESSVAFLDKEFEHGGEELQKSLVFIISQHNTPRSFDFLKKTALDASRSLEIRKDAVFWVGNSQDPKSLGLLREILDTAREEELKEQVVFALTLTDRPEAVAEIIRIAKSDPDLEVRKKAIFWLGQKASQESVKTLKDLVDEQNEEVEVKDSAVFAISQLPKDKAVPMLVAIAKNNRSPAIRKKAIFWLGQTGEEEALKLFEEILLKKR